jgi:hypothetical protein
MQDATQPTRTRRWVWTSAAAGAAALTVGTPGAAEAASGTDAHVARLLKSHRSATRRAFDALVTAKLKPFMRAAAMEPESIMVGDITRAPGGAIAKARVVWPDGTVGVFTATSINAQCGAIDEYTITHGRTTYTQPAVTRDDTGAVIHRPKMVVR